MASPLPKWKMLVEDIKAKIASGEYNPGDKLPSTSQLCAVYSVSPMVIRNAMVHLKAEKLVMGVPGVGTYVVAVPE